MGFDSRHRDNLSAGEDLAEELAQTHRLELAHARDVLHRAEHAAGADPQARSVRQWFALLVDEAAAGPAATGKQTELEAPLEDRSARPSPPQPRARPAPGRETLVMREAHLEGAPSGEPRVDAAKRAPQLLDVGQEWRSSQALGIDFSGVSIRRDAPEAGGRGGDARRPEIARIRAAIGSLGGGGSPLPRDLQRDYGALLGLDLGGVRIHENHGETSALGAQAFTHGSNIAVAPGLDARSGPGRHVVAHELIHVGQNMKAGGDAMAFAARLDVGPSDSAIEQEAETGAAALSSGRPFSIGSHGALPGISLFKGPTPEGDPPPTPPSNPTPTPAPTPTGSNPTPNPATPTPTPAPNPANPTPGPTPGPAPTPGPTPGPAPTGPTGPTGPTATPDPTGATPTSNPTQNPAQNPAQAPTPAPTRGPTPTPTLDERVKQALEQRADPALKAGYGKACAQIDILRINAVQYTFQPTGLGTVLLQSVWPWEALKEHGRQVSLTNPYPDGSLQAWIEGARGVIRILGDIAAWVATIADIVAAVSGLLALITSETVIGGLAFGAIAIIAAEVGTIAGLIKIILDLIDALISVVQMLILIDKIRKSKDPNERAKMAALLQRECKEFAGTMTGVVVQVGTIVLTAGLAAGVGAAFAKSLKGFGKAFMRELGAEFRPLLNARKSLNIIKDAATPKAPVPTRVTGDAATITPEELTGGAVVMQRIETRRVLVKSKLSRAKRKGKPKQWRDIVTVTETKILSPSDIPKKAPKGDKAIKRELRYVIDPNKIRHGITIQVFHDPVKDGSAIPAGQVGGNTQADVKKPGDPTSPPPGGTPPKPEDRPGAAPLTQVAMWPSMLEQLQATKAPLAPANDRLMTQYNLAKDQAGTYHTGQVEKALGGAKNNAGQMRFSALQKEGDATEGAANTQQGTTTAGGAKDKKTQLDANASKAESSVAKMGGQKVEKPQPKPGNWFDQAKQWLYDNTIGQIGALAASLQKWISDTVGGWAMAQAGLTKEELDMAGIEDSMRADNLKDKKTAEEMKAAKEDAAKIDPAVAELMKSASKDEQLAIQAMVEAQEFMTALDEADKTLDQAITEGTAYITAVTPIIRHELETQTEGKAIDAAYVAPVVSGATGFKTAAGGTEELAGPPAVDANGELEAARTMWPDLNIGPGVAQIATAKAAFVASHGAAVTTARAAADAAIATVNGLVGSSNYAGVTAAARTLEAAMNAFTGAEERAADAYVAALDQIIQAHVDLINGAIEQQEVPVDLDGDGVADEATPPPAETGPQ